MVGDESLADFVAWLQVQKIPLKENAEIARLSQIKAGGVFRLLVECETEAQLLTLLSELGRRSLPYKVIGNLSNILFRDGEIRTIGITTRKMLNLSFDDAGFVSAESGVLLPTLAKRLTCSGHAGFAGLVGVPASIGGAVYMNASCYGDAVSDYLVDVRCVNSYGEFRVFDASSLRFAWRYSAFHDALSDWVIVSARFKPQLQGGAEEEERERQIKQHRREYQENKLPNLGSIFATPDIYSAIARHFLFYRVLLMGVRAICRFCGAKRHHYYAKLARGLSKAYFGLKGSEAVDFSEFTFNCVVNRGGAKGNDLIDFVLEAQEAIDGCVPLEIELHKDIE
jgi:UDP-N-acetylmuramate dehydrogenase